MKRMYIAAAGAALVLAVAHDHASAADLPVSLAEFYARKAAVRHDRPGRIPARSVLRTSRPAKLAELPADVRAASLRPTLE